MSAAASRYEVVVVKATQLILYTVKFMSVTVLGEQLQSALDRSVSPRGPFPSCSCSPCSSSGPQPEPAAAFQPVLSCMSWPAIFASVPHSGPLW